MLFRCARASLVVAAVVIVGMTACSTARPTAPPVAEADACAALGDKLAATLSIVAIEEGRPVGDVLLQPKAGLWDLSYDPTQMAMGTGVSSRMVVKDGAPHAYLIEGHRFTVQVQQNEGVPVGHFLLNATCDRPHAIDIEIPWPTTAKVGDVVELKVTAAPVSIKPAGG